MQLLNSKTAAEEKYLENWPQHYYEIKQADQKEACLKYILEKNPDSADDKRRLELLYRRYGKYPDEKRDKFFHAWSLIKATGRETVNVFNRKIVEKEFFGYMNELFLAPFDRDAIVEEEWHAFAKQFLELSGNSPAFKTSGLLGFRKLSAEDTAFRLANDIEFITRKIPRRFQCEKEFEDFAKIMEDTFVEMTENGAEILDAVKKGRTTI